MESQFKTLEIITKFLTDLQLAFHDEGLDFDPHVDQDTDSVINYTIKDFMLDKDFKKRVWGSIGFPIIVSDNQLSVDVNLTTTKDLKLIGKVVVVVLEQEDPDKYKMDIKQIISPFAFIRDWIDN